MTYIKIGQHSRALKLDFWSNKNLFLCEFLIIHTSQDPPTNWLYSIKPSIHINSNIIINCPNLIFIMFIRLLRLLGSFLLKLLCLIHPKVFHDCQRVHKAQPNSANVPDEHQLVNKCNSSVYSESAAQVTLRYQINRGINRLSASLDLLCWQSCHSSSFIKWIGITLWAFHLNTTVKK